MKFEDLEKFSKVICQDYIILEELIKKETWDEIYEYIWQMQFERWPQDKKVTNPLKEEAKEKRNKIKDEIKKIKEKIFISDSKQAGQDIKEMYNILNSLKNIVLEFMQDYSKAKKEKNIIDFNDIDKVNSNGIIFVLDTLPFWYMIETLNDNGKLIRREFKKFKEFDKDYRQ